MGPNIIVLDLETKRTFDELGERDPGKLGITVVGAYLYSEKAYRIFREDKICDLEELLMKKPLLVGFNIKRFDLPVLKPYLKIGINDIPILDIMDEMSKLLGHRVSLNNVAMATLGASKSAGGLDAIRYYKNGEWDKLEKYCLDDVRLTKELFEYGAERKELFYLTKFDQARARVPVNWEIKGPEVEEKIQYKLW